MSDESYNSVTVSDDLELQVIDDSVEEDLSIFSTSKPTTSNDSTAMESFIVRTNRKKTQVIESDISEDESKNESNNISEDASDNELNTSSSIHDVPESEDENADKASGSNSETARCLGASFSTPRIARKPSYVSSESEEEEEDIVISSDEESIKMVKKIEPVLKPIQHQVKLIDMFARMSEPDIRQTPKSEPTTSKPADIQHVSQLDYDAQKQRVLQVQMELTRAANALRTVNLSALPDKGNLILQKQNSLKASFEMEKKKLEKMVIKQDEAAKSQPFTWDDLKAATAAVTLDAGKKAMATLNQQKILTLDTLEELHNSLKTCPDENTVTGDPMGLKVELMTHQRRALAWLMWREGQKPSGGILADDMGLGKTLTTIALHLKVNEIEGQHTNDENDRSSKYPGGTLVICPASLINQWEGEIKKRTRHGLVDVEVYHGAKRETRPKRLAKHDIVITTYSLVQNDCEKSGPVFAIKWRRIILDEAHQVRNHKTLTSAAVCYLSAKSRWALTGTPVHNKEEDLYGLLKFLRCSPFDDLAVWKRWVKDKSTGGQERLNTVISSLMLRRTKEELQINGALTCLPQRQWELIKVPLLKNETDVYQKILVFSRTLFAQFLHQRAEKQQDTSDQFYSLNSRPNAEFFKMHQKLVKTIGVKEVKQHHILVLLLRLRQICCHPSLITQMLEGESLDDDDEEREEFNILEQLGKLKLDETDEHHDVAEGLSQPSEPVGVSEAARGILNPDNPIFKEDHLSSKIKAVLNVLEKTVLQGSDKGIIVSQWTGFLRLVSLQLKERGIKFSELNGSVPVHKRMELVNDFNNPKHPTKILLLSLTAGGVGLNLIGANHLFLVDLHWNPQLEMQAQDRIYRVGQMKQVNVYKFMTIDTIEERIKALQDRKLDIANALLTGSKLQSNKLTLADLKLLFNM